MDVRIEDLPEMRVAVVLHSGPYNTITSAFTKLAEIAGPAGLFGQPTTRMIAIYYDDPESKSVELLRSAAGLTVSSDTALPSQLTEVRLPAGRWACAIHQGSYGSLGTAWQRMLGEWLPSSGLRRGSGECFEQYLNTPAEVREEDLRTLLYVPIQA